MFSASILMGVSFFLDFFPTALLLVFLSQSTTDDEILAGTGIGIVNFTLKPIGLVKLHWKFHFNGNGNRIGNSCCSRIWG